jgi:hypothetical protein
MVRRYDEVIEVRETSTSGPALFLWRGRVYAVRSVLGHWRERRAWWLEGATARLLGLEPSVSLTSPTSSTSSTSSMSSTEPAGDSGDDTAGAAAVADVLEREIWRVEAGAGRSDTVGVYDLGRDVIDLGDLEIAPAIPAPRAHWRLLQIAD